MLDRNSRDNIRACPKCQGNRTIKQKLPNGETVTKRCVRCGGVGTVTFGYQTK